MKGLLGKMALLTLGVTTVGLSVAATPAQAHEVYNDCGWSTSQTIQSDGWGNAVHVQESFNTCDGEHVVTQNGYLVHRDYHGVRRGPQRPYPNHGHVHPGPHNHPGNGVPEFFLGLGLGILLGR